MLCLTDILVIQPFRASQLRPPGSRLPAPNLRPGTLSEITESQNNARPQPSMLPQAGVKRTHTGSSMSSSMPSSHRPRRRTKTDDCIHIVSQPPPDAKQRKTLMERAAEYPDKHSVAATPAPRVLNKGVSLASQTGVSSAYCDISPFDSSFHAHALTGAFDNACPGSPQAPDFTVDPI